jgi:uncharacterized protein YggE
MKQDNTKILLIVVMALGFAVIALAILFAPQPQVSVSGGGDAAVEKNTVSVRGEASFEVDPDEAEVFIRIKTEEPTANRAQEENARLMSAVKNALKKDGVKEDEMETTSYNLWPQQKWDRETEEYIETGFVAQHLLKVTTDDVTEVGHLLDTAVLNGANGLDRVNFKLSDKKKEDVNSEALAQAANNAEEKAKAITQSLGVRLGDINRVSESNVDYGYYRAPMFDMVESAAAVSEKSFDTEISPQSVTVTAYISILYEIE